MQEMLIDYLTFSLKPDQLSENKRDVDLDFIIRLLNLGDEFLNFENVGGRNGYPVCYTYNDVLIHVPAPEHYERMGYCVMFKGNGLRWYNSIFKSFSLVDFLTELVALTDTGLSLNISRIDVAMDDKQGILDMDEIMRKSERHEYISTSRTMQKIREVVTYKNDDIAGRTIYFGSRKSSSYIRIYDKAAEQGVSGHWIRVEFEFKQETAMRIVNAIITTRDKFQAYFCEVANHYLRFIELDDCNRSRCSTSDFWARFLDTVNRAKLSIAGYKRKTLTRLFDYMVHAYSPSLYVLLKSFPRDFLLEMFVKNGKGRLKRKHTEMLKHPDIFDTPFSNSEKWGKEIPLSAEMWGQTVLA